MDMINKIQQLVKSGFSDWKLYGNVLVKRLDDLQIFNYTAKANQSWNEFEILSRGLIIRDDGEIVARPFDKFFNWGEGGRHTNAPIIRVTEKLDGTMGTLYFHKGFYRIATRGSFEGMQANWATEFLNKKYNLQNLNDKITLIFEIIYPDNRIVVDYGDKEDLVLLAARHKETGEYYTWNYVINVAKEFGFSLPKVFNFSSTNDILNQCQQIDENNEGWVVDFFDGQRFKFKGQQYCELHKMISSVSFKNILKYVADGRDLSSLLINLPHKYRNQVIEWLTEIENKVIEVTDKVIRVFEIAPKHSRKQFAEWVKEYHPKESQYLFLLFDNKPINQLIYKREFV